MTEGNGGSRNPLRESLLEQLRRMRGPRAVLPDALLDVVVDTATPGGGDPVSVLRPRDWDELRHQEGADGHTAPYWARMWPSGLALADTVVASAVSAASRPVAIRISVCRGASRVASHTHHRPSSAVSTTR